MIIKSLDHLRLISNKIADNVSEKDCIFLIGEIGVGKTTFTRYFINYLQQKKGVKQTEVLSPTFNLLYEYDIKNLKIMHYDLYRIKNKKELRDDGDALKLPLISVERTTMTKDPDRKGAFQAQIYANDKNGRSGRMVIARRILEDKTRNFAVASQMRRPPKNAKHQPYFPRTNKKIVVQTLSIPIPIYVTVNYKISLISEYQQQQNELVAPFIARPGQINSFVMKRNGHLYEAFVDSEFTHSNNVSDLAEESRQFMTEINIKVLGYLIGEGENDDRELVKIEESVVEVTFPRESIPLPGDPSLLGE